MLCSECGAEVSVLREFCPKCGTPTDPSLRSARKRVAGAGDPRDLQSNRKRVFVIGGAVLLSALAIGSGNWFDWDSHHRPSPPQQKVEEAKGPVTIDADKLYAAFRDDPDAAERRFEDREMVVTGEFLRIVPDGYGSLDLRLKTSNPEDPLGVDVAGVAIEDAKKLRPGQQVTVSCQRMGDGDDTVWVRDCAIQPNADPVKADDAAAKAPAPPAAPVATGPADGKGE